MTGVRKGVAGFCLFLFVLGAPRFGEAQPSQSPGVTGVIKCAVAAAPVDVRVEETAAALGDIILRCISGPEAADFPFTHVVTNFAIDLNVNVANNLITVPGGNERTTDAVLAFSAFGFFGTGSFDIYNPKASSTINGEVLFDSPANGPGFSCSPPGACDQPPAPIFPDPQLGEVFGPTTLRWNGVQIPVPGLIATFPGNPFPFAVPEVVTLRFTNIRGNAATFSGAPAFPPRQVLANISVAGPTNLVLDRTQVAVGNALTGLQVSQSDLMIGLQCNTGQVTKYVKLTEGFPSAFRTIGVPTFTPGQTQWESGYPVFSENDPGSMPLSGVNGGGVTQGTRFIIRFFNVPDGVEIMAPYRVSHDPDDGPPFEDEGGGGFCLDGATTETSPSLELRLVTGADPNGFGGSITSNDTTCTQGGDAGGASINVPNGFGAIVYEVFEADGFQVEMATIPFKFSWTPDLENNLPTPGVLQASASFAPLSNLTQAAPNGNPVPRFVDLSEGPQDLFGIQKCVTVLLFPWVTNQSGFDTGFAIANTSEDWLGTDPQVGSCTLHFHGETVGGGTLENDTQTSVPIPGGDVLLFTLSGGNTDYGIEGAPEFSGYVIAVCEFQFAHGFAFITDGFGGIPTLAQGYLALVVHTASTAGGGRTLGSAGMEFLGK